VKPSQSYRASPTIWDQITQCYLPPDTGEHAQFKHRQTGRYSIYLPWTDRRLSWPACWLYTEMVYLSTDSHPS